VPAETFYRFEYGVRPVAGGSIFNLVLLVERGGVRVKPEIRFFDCLEICGRKEASGSCLCTLNEAVDRLEHTIRDARREPSQDSRRIFAERARDADHFVAIQVQDSG
jgi:hypothetical protein